MSDLKPCPFCGKDEAHVCDHPDKIPNEYEGGRVSIYQIPSVPHRCCMGGRYCVYRDSRQICEDPRIHKGNSDAACHRMNNQDLLPHLEALSDE